MALDMEVGIGPGHIVVDGEPAPPFPKMGQSTPNFRPMSISVFSQVFYFSFSFRLVD